MTDPINKPATAAGTIPPVTQVGLAAPASIAAQQQAPTMAQMAAMMEQMQKLQEQFALLQQLAPDAAAKLAAEEITELPEKTYHTTLPHSAFDVMRGVGISEKIFFSGTELTTTDPVIQRFLDAIADKPTSPIYTKKAHDDYGVLAAAAENRANSAATMDKLIKAGLRPQ